MNGPSIRPVTFAFDLLGEIALPGSQTTGDCILDAALGVKVNPWWPGAPSFLQNTLVLLNGLVALNNTGLRDTITPLIGVEVTSS